MKHGENENKNRSKKNIYKCSHVMWSDNCAVPSYMWKDYRDIVRDIW